jgi:putative redox protein
VNSHPVVVEDTGSGQFQVRAQAQGPSFLVDEPASLGGLASGPTPYDLLSSALGACTVMTLKMYARRHGLPLTRVQVSVAHDRDEATGAETFVRTIYLDGALSPEQEAKLLSAADRCPVGKTLHMGASITTELTRLRRRSTSGGPCDETHVAAMDAACEETG